MPGRVSEALSRTQPLPAAETPPVSQWETAARRTDAPPVAPAGSDQGRDGWLSDLLGRADNVEQEPPRRAPAPPPAAAANPLESLSLDIGRLMDRTLAAEMWDRYQRGESKAFTKRLYTPAGQKAFDEVSRKYRSDRPFKQTVDRYITEFERLLDEVARKYRADRGFKQTVDRYIAEFERLLDEVAREDRGPQALRGHLTSETGLVYTLLAHAAGRLG